MIRSRPSPWRILAALLLVYLGTLVVAEVTRGQIPADQLQLQPRPFMPVQPPTLPALPPGPPSPPPPPAANGVSATATFAPAVLPLMRFGEYRVTIIGAVSGIELPDTIPTPDGLILDLTDKAPGITNQNGRNVMSMTFRYSATASRAGSFIVPSFTATVGGVPVTVPAAQLLVQEPGPADQPYQAAQAVLDIPAGEYFVGQMIPGRLLVLDTPDETVQAVVNVTKPSGDFLFQSQAGFRREQLPWEGKRRTAASISLRLTPIKAGESDVSVQTIVYLTKLNAIGRSSGNSAQAILDTPPVRIQVQPLPSAGKPASFTGAIGRFEIARVSLSSAEVIAGDPLTLTVTIAGAGNLEAISAPAVPDDPGWQTFAPSMNVERGDFTGPGNKIITYTLIPRSPETKQVPLIPFSYFDPEQKKYVELPIPPQPITVKPDKSSPPPATATPAPAAAATPEATPAPKAAAEPVYAGLVEVSGPWRSSPSPVVWSRWFWAGQTLPAVALLGLWYWRRRCDFLAAHPEIVRRRVARAAARRQIKLARRAIRQRDTDGFVEASIDAIRAAAAPLDTTEAQSLVFQELIAIVPHEGAAEETVRRLYEHAHRRHYSGHPDSQQGSLDLLAQVRRTVAVIERHQP